MNRKQASMCRIVVGILIGVTVGISIAIGNVFPALGALLVGTAVSFICNKKMTDVVNDEMVYRMSEKASRRVVQIFTPAIAIIGLVLITLKDSYPDLYTIGLVLAYSACGILVIYMLFYSYYSRKGL